MGNVIRSKEIEEKIATYIQSRLSCSAHDYDHTLRVKK